MTREVYKQQGKLYLISKYFQTLSNIVASSGQFYCLWGMGGLVNESYSE
jgi:hypothetical protein